MSGGKKKPARIQGWEEAGAEFYQECFPTDAEFDAVVQRDPRHLATLLPSKQNRTAAATIRIRTNNRTIRRQTASRSRRESTIHRRASIAGDTQVTMPDLSALKSTEETAYEDILLIKAMPIPMSEKKMEKAKILHEPNLILQGYEQFKWKRRKMWGRTKSRLKETFAKMSLWKGTLKRIEGHFGTGVVAYFIFLKYLFFLNVFMFTLIFLFVTLPTILAYNSSSNNTNAFVNTNSTSSNDVLDFIQGTGFMERTYLFYGYYPNEVFEYYIDETAMYYNLPLAYICITVVYFMVSLVIIVKSAAQGFKDRLVESEGQFYQYCNLVFGGWDFCIHNEKSAQIKHKALYNELKGCLEVERLAEIRHARTRNELIRLITMRIIVNILVLSVLGACGYGIYRAFDFSIQQKALTSDSFVKLFYEFMPSLTIVCFNILVPFIFRYLIRFENYSPAFVIRLTLFRTVLLRLASIFTLYGTLYDEIKGLECWETYVGQQIYKLVLTDFATHVVVTFLINFPRAALARQFDNKFIKFIGEQSFDLPKHVLDVVYSQTLCWFGCFYAPLLSAAFSLLFFLMFYIKKFVCLVNSNPSSTIYRASRSNSMFMVILLISFISSILPLSYSISELTPSSKCGPFKNTTYVWNFIEETFMETPAWIQYCFNFLSTAGFAVPVFIVLFLLLYYYRAINSANRHMVSVLKNQLVLEGHDKQFLMERLTKFLKQQQENQMRIRHVDVLQDGDTNLSSN